MNDKKKDLCIYRIRNAVETLGVAALCLGSQHYKDSINRSYYDDFYVASLTDATDQYNSSKLIIDEIEKYLAEKGIQY